MDPNDAPEEIDASNTNYDYPETNDEHMVALVTNSSNGRRIPS
jgi:hypothetical protein